ncbi:hypothetical protein GCM10009712_24950 [Pseudarthrobacter sulfonivorans]|uniref:hypothetical protein n=1 Tax=Pseudarthrobacter sulfonivorans TaxID=121292 RepID=UPI00168B0F69|nr:hypothetical protein [Pseudarthrobacter sulfonivorans]
MSDIAGTSSDGTVDGLLRDAGFDDDAVLRSALQDLRGLAAGQPEASAAVAALMVPAHTRRLAAVPAPASGPDAITQTQPVHAPAAPAAPITPDDAHESAAPSATDELAARRRAKRRITLTTLSVAVSLAAGGAVAVASDQGLRDSIGHMNQAVSSFVATVGGGSVPARQETPVPLPAQPVSPATVPTAPTVTQPVPAAPGSNSSRAPAESPGKPSPAPAVTQPDLPVPENLTPDLPEVPTRLPNGQGQPPALPLPSTPPVPLPGDQP